MATVTVEQFKQFSFEQKLVYWSQLSDDFEVLTDLLVIDIVARYSDAEAYDKAKGDLIDVFLLALPPKDREIYSLSEETLGKGAVTEEEKALR